jgi:hypothetical protein
MLGQLLGTQHLLGLGLLVLIMHIHVMYFIADCQPQMEAFFTSCTSVILLTSHIFMFFNFTSHMFMFISCHLNKLPFSIQHNLHVAAKS